MAKAKKETKNLVTKAGEEITPEIADALAVEAGRGYDLSKAKRRQAGQIRGVAPSASAAKPPRPDTQAG